MGASKATRLAILTAMDGDSTSAGQGNTNLPHTAWDKRCRSTGAGYS